MKPNPLSEIRLIGISGKLGSGKTSLAVYLQTLDPRIQKHSFAEKLREVLQVMTGVTPSETRSTDQKNRVLPGWDKSVGALLQDVGEAVRQTVHPDAWVLALDSEWQTAQRERGNSVVWVLDDVRHVNEAQWVLAQGGIMVRMEGDPAQVRARSNRNLDHISETALDDFKHFDAVLNSETYRNHWPAMYGELLRQLSERK